MPFDPAVQLRPLEVSDAGILASWSLDERFCAAAEWSPDLPLAEHQRFQSRLIAEPPNGLVRLGVVHDGELVGYVVLQGPEPQRRELGFVIGDSRRWGHGLGAQAAQAALDHGFTDLGLHEIWAEAWAANPASVRILQRLGMREIERGESGTYLGAPTYYRRFTIAAPTLRAGPDTA
ncbi:GNAT family N-acetyltransferase [Krasilnikovia sp. MM14-A1259]|uniref:GNAT family N-acetyltransferase n=1 Tax=Krasilnikovia sp. MM14-A1259 TaxID=3373539 RepID=UPI00380EA973